MMSNKVDIKNVDPSEELRTLLEQKQQIDAQLETAKKSLVYHTYKSLINFLEEQNLHIKEFFEIGERHYQQEYGKRPLSTSKDISFTPSGKRRILPLKYRDTVNTENTWSGRGKHPNWLLERIDQGFKMEDFLIKPRK